MDIRKYILDRLPQYYWDNDTYKDESGHGILVRFLGMLGVSINEDLITPLEEFINELDPETAASKFLSLLAFTVGNPIDIIGTDESYRKRLMSAISLYKLKGTRRSYDLLFALLGYKVEITENHLPDMRYDIGLMVDDGVTPTEPYLFDNDECTRGCVSYSLSVFEADGVTPAQLSDEIKQALAIAIKDIEPINARLLFIAEGYGNPFTRQFTEEFGIKR